MDKSEFSRIRVKNQNSGFKLVLDGENIRLFIIFKAQRASLRLLKIKMYLIILAS